MQLDTKRASRVYGSSRATWFQDGQYFTHDGTPISFDEAAQPDPHDLEMGVVKLPAPEPEPPATPSYEVVKAAPKEPEYVALEEPKVERPNSVDATYGDTRLLKLKALKGTILAAMVLRAGGTPETGLGSKKKNIAWLLENVPE